MPAVCRRADGAVTREAPGAPLREARPEPTTARGGTAGLAQTARPSAHRRLDGDAQLRLRRRERERRRAVEAEEDTQRPLHPFEAQDVVPVGRHLDLVGDHLLAGRSAARLCSRVLLLLHVVQLDAKLEAELLELVLRVRAAEGLKERIS